MTNALGEGLFKYTESYAFIAICKLDCFCNNAKQD